MVEFQKFARCGFRAKWVIDETNIFTKRTFVSPIETTDGMPDVKWFLKWNYDILKNRFHLSLNVESENEIEYSINLYKFKQRDELAYKKNGKSNGKEIVELESVSTFSLNDLINGKLLITVDGYFSYTKKPKFQFSDALIEWGSCLKEVFPTDFDIHVENQIIKITKNFVAVESSVFARMFESDNFKEAKENKVTITDSQYEIVEAAMNYCYRQNITNIFEDLNKCIELLYFCNKYDFKSLKPIVEANLSTKLSKESIYILVSTSEKANALQLRKSCIEYICGLRNTNDKLSADIIATFEKQFLADALFHSLN